MPDAILVESKRICDLSQPEELVHTFVSIPVKSRWYKTKLTPLCLTPAKSSDHGADVLLSDQNGNVRPEWISAYNTATNNVKIWTRPAQYTPAVRHNYVLTIGNSIPPGDISLGGSIAALYLDNYNAFGEVHKIVVTDMIENSINEIASGVSVCDEYALTCYRLAGTIGYGLCWMISYSFSPGPDYLWYSISNCASQSIVIDSQGVIHFAYINMDGGVNAAYHAYSSTYGKTWTIEKINHNFSSKQTHVNIVVDSADTVHFAWTEEEPVGGIYGNGNEHIKYRNKNSSGVWSAVEVISNPVTSGVSTTACPCMSLMPDSLSIGVTFNGLVCDGGIMKEYLYYNTRSPLGVWSGYEAVQEVRSVSSIDYDSSSIPHVVYMSYNAGAGGKWDAYYTNRSGGSWSAPVLLESDVGAISNVVIDLIGNLHVCYTHGGEIYHVKRYFDGSFSSATSVSTTSVDFVSIQVNSIGECQVVYINNGMGCYRIVDNSLTVGEEHVWYYVSGNEVGSFAIPWSHYPIVNDQFIQLSRESNCFAFSVGTAPFPSSGYLMFTADDPAVIGGVSDLSSATYISERQRGVIDQTSYQRVINPGLIN